MEREINKISSRWTVRLIWSGFIPNCVVLTPHAHLATKLKKEYSYTSTHHLCLHGMLQGTIYLFIPNCLYLVQFNWSTFSCPIKFHHCSITWSTITILISTTDHALSNYTYNQNGPTVLQMFQFNMIHPVVLYQYIIIKVRQ